MKYEDLNLVTFTQESNLIGWQEKYSQISHRFLDSYRRNQCSLESSNIKKRRYLGRQPNINSTSLVSRPEKKIFEQKAAMKNRYSLKKVATQPTNVSSVNRLLLDIPNYFLNSSIKNIKHHSGKKKSLFKHIHPKIDKKKQNQSSLTRFESFLAYELPQRTERSEKIRMKPFLTTSHKGTKSSLNYKFKTEC